MHKLKINWEKVPWQKLGDASIAEKYNCSRVTVWINRQRYAPNTCRNPIAASRYGKVNWKLRDEDIANKLGVSVATIAKRRSQAGAPPQPRKVGFKTGRKPSIKAAYDPLLTVKENAKRMGCSEDTVHYHRKKMEAKGGVKPAAKKTSKLAKFVEKFVTPAAKKPEAKKPAAKKPAAKKPATPAAKKPATPAAKKPEAKKPATPAAKKPATKKPAATVDTSVLEGI